MGLDTKSLAKIMKALANEHRLALYLEIARTQRTEIEEHGCMVSKIMTLFKLSAPTISHHIRELANAGLIDTERRGKHLIATIRADTLTQVEAVLTAVKG